MAPVDKTTWMRGLALMRAKQLGQEAAKDAEWRDYYTLRRLQG